MRPVELPRRIDRLDQLLRGLAREILLWQHGNDPLLYVERLAYLQAIRDALAGIEAARVVLARAHQRLTPGSSANDPKQNAP